MEKFNNLFDSITRLVFVGHLLNLNNKHLTPQKDHLGAGTYQPTMTAQEDATTNHFITQTG